jgi:6-phosphogluconolactonase
MINFKIYKDPQAVAEAAADYLYQRIKTCVANKNQCHVVLPGGSTPAHCLELLAQKPLPWKNIHWHPGDERCLPPGHADRNDTMMIERLFSQQPQAIKNFHPIPAELGPQQGAENYTKIISSIHNLDIVVLGMGEDGHTASLFPENAALNDLRCVVPVFNAPKPPDERVSIGLTTLANATECIVLVTGKAKREALQLVQQGVELPITQARPNIWFVDESAVQNRQDAPIN